METTKLKSIVDLFEEIFPQDNNETIEFYLYEVCDNDGEKFSPTGHILYSFDRVGEDVLKEITEPGQAVYIDRIKMPVYTLRKIIDDSMYLQTKLFFQIIEYLDKHEHWINNN